MATAISYGVVSPVIASEFRVGFTGYHVARFQALAVADIGFLQVREDIAGGVKMVIPFAAQGQGYDWVFVWFYAEVGDLVEFTVTPTHVFYGGAIMPQISGGITAP